MKKNYKLYLLLGLVLLVGCKDKPNIIITSEPPGASVLEDSNDKVLGTTPYEEYRKEIGSYQYLLRLKHYKDVKVIIDLKEVTSVQTKEIQLTDLRNVSIVTEPPGASITGLGVEGEVTPYRGELKPGKYELKLTKEGYDPEKLSFKITKEGESFDKKIQLWNDRANVAINSEPTGATLSGEGFSSKTTPFYEEIKLGKYEVTVSKDGHHEEKLTINVASPKDRIWKEVKLLTNQEYDKKVECEKQGLDYVKGECSEWSRYMGLMSWDAANAKCRSLGLRLPTIKELEAAYRAGITNSWQNGNIYCSSTPYDAESYYKLVVYNGNTLDDDRWTSL